MGVDCRGDVMGDFGVDPVKSGCVVNTILTTRLFTLARFFSLITRGKSRLSLHHGYH
jgi:hypothetical protein